MRHHFEIYRDKAGEYRVRFKYNSEVIWSSEGYSSKASALNLIESVKKNGPGSEVIDQVVAERDLLDHLRGAEIPASDRIVRPDHNSKEFKDFEAVHENLTDKFRRSNDLREFTSDEIEIAKSEIAEIGVEGRKSNFRAEHLWLKAKSALLWVAEKAADGIVKALAVALLVAIASLIGIPLPV
jgi:hypothetical protein|tara:strand:+ start:212 stop:760 length:549 start_codon:yes stop_codon:yes gene_type:complete